MSWHKSPCSCNPLRLTFFQTYWGDVRCLRKVVRSISMVGSKAPMLMLKLVACAGSSCTSVGCQSAVWRNCHHRRVSVTAICLLAAISRSHHCCGTSRCLWLLQELVVIIRSVVEHEQLCCMRMTMLPLFFAAPALYALWATHTQLYSCQ